MKKTLLFVLFFLNLSQVTTALQFHTSVDTLNTITEIIAKQEKGIYLRFGDGDVVLACGDNDSYQVGNPSLQQEMNEAFALNGPNVLKCLPLHCAEFGGFEEGMMDGKHSAPYEWCQTLLDRARPKWNGEVDDVYSMVALAYVATDHLDVCLQFLQFLKQSGCCLLVGNANIPSSLRELLFGEQCQFVPTPPRNSYDQIDWIEQEVLRKIEQIDGYKIIVTSMGCSGRALQKRLWRKLDDVFLFDFGSLMDAMCGWNTRGWITLSHFDSKQFLNVLEKNLSHNSPL